MTNRRGDVAGVSVTVRPELPVDRESVLQVERLAFQQARDDLGALASDALHMDMSRWPFVARAGANIAYIAVCFLIVTQLLLR